MLTFWFVCFVGHASANLEEYGTTWSGGEHQLTTKHMKHLFGEPWEGRGGGG